MAVVAVKTIGLQRYEYKASGGETEISPPISLLNREVFVYLNGTLLAEGINKDYTINEAENKIVFLLALNSNDVVQVITL